MKLPTGGTNAAMTRSFHKLHIRAEGMSEGITPSACVSAKVRGGQTCLRLPIKLPFIDNQVYLPAPGVPNLGEVNGYCNLRKKFGIPTNIKCYIKFHSSEITYKSFP